MTLRIRLSLIKLIFVIIIVGGLLYLAFQLGLFLAY